MATVAELQTCDPADVPRTREGIRAYFEAMRPKLAGSEAAQRVQRSLKEALDALRGSSAKTTSSASHKSA